MSNIGSMRDSARSLRQDAAVLEQRIKPGTIPRILHLAAPYKRLLAFFLLVICLDAAIGVVTPLLYRDLINEGILHDDVRLVVALALLAALLYVIDAG
jgi:ATP-binding cassette subfamily B protein